MTVAEFDSIAIEAYISGAWVSIITDVKQNPPPQWNMGIMGNGPTDRVGDPEYFTFSLDNSEGNSAGLKGYYTPGHNNCRAGWTTGINVRLVFTFESVTFYKWYGKIMPDGIDVTPGIYGPRDVKVHCHGFMAQAADHPFDLPTLVTNVTADTAMTALLTNMPIQPLATSFAVGISTFPTAFDTVRRNTTALDEMFKIAMSELCYIYTRGDKTGGQTLVCENRNTRTSATTMVVPLGGEDEGFCLNEDGGFALNEDGSKVINDESESTTFADKAIAMDTSFGKHLTNFVPANTYPRKVDSAATTILFQTQERIALEAGETLTGIRGDYRDPNGGASYVAGKEMVTPVSNTDYWMDSVKGSDAKDLTGSLVVTATYGTEGVDYSIHNTGGTKGYVYLQARGKGIYIYDVVSRLSQDTASQAIYGKKPLTIDMKYQNDPALGDSYANYVLIRNSTPQTTVEKYEMFANKDSNGLLAFLYGEPGQRAPFSEAMTAVNGDYFIMGYTAKIVNGKHVVWSPILSSIGQDTGWILETSALDSTTVLGYTQFG